VSSTAHRAGSVLERVRTSCAEVAEAAEWVRIDPDRLERLAAELAAAGIPAEPAPTGPWAVPTDDPETAAALVLVLDAINFGSGYHPFVTKRPGCSGATTMATSLREWASEPHRLHPERLATLDPATVHAVFGQPHDGGPVDELMGLFTRALNDLGALVAARYDGRYLALVEAADASAARLVELLDAMPLFHDVPSHRGREVPLYKRAQLTAADLHRTFGGAGPGRFDDVDRLTAFADNLVPHVLRLEGVLRYDPALAARIDRGEPLTCGTPEEVEIRAVGVHAVELLADACRRAGRTVPPRTLDLVLWTRGGEPRYKAVPRHRARSWWY
jgi:hypothetical protein